MNTVVNVSSVPQRSPFRYPGGKTWLVPVIRRWLGCCGHDARTLVEPFAGGGIVSLTAVFEGFVDNAVLVELDPDVASVWQTMLNGQGQWLANQIRNFEFEREAVMDWTKKKCYVSKRDQAFATILRNRISRGGILAPGAGVVKSGENGKGLRSRWYPATLGKRIQQIVGMKKHFCILEQDGISFLQQHANESEEVFFIDPPYTKAGRRLYRFSEVDHEQLFSVVSHLAGDFLMTYDDSNEIQNLGRKHGFKIAKVPMRGTHHVQKMELLISRDLSWLN